MMEIPPVFPPVLCDVVLLADEVVPPAEDGAMF